MINLEKLLLPIDEAKPAGEDLRLSVSDTTFGDIREKRREIDPAIEGGDAKTADWLGIVRECESALIEKSKDLEIASYLTQGLVVQNGFEGLGVGLQLVRGLLENFWDSLHPGLDEGEIILGIRARPLSWLGSSQEFLRSVKQVPITGAVGQTPRSWYDYEQSKRVDEAGVKADQSTFQDLLAVGLITGEEWRSSLAGTPIERLAATVEQLEACSQEFFALNDLCTEKFGEEAPHLLDLRNVIADSLDFLKPLVVEQEAAGGTAIPGQEGSSLGQGGIMAGPIQSRDHAYQLLREIADYLRRTEPHSPVASLIDRAVKWGNMSFDTLFQDVIKDQGVRNQVAELLGLPPPGQP